MAEEKPSDVFLSHDWGTENINHMRVQKINEELKNRNVATFFDTDPGGITDELNSDMAKAIEGTKVGLVFVTQAYHDKVDGKAYKGTSDNCYMEFSYMTMKITKAKMLTVVLEPEMKDPKKWNGPLGFQMSGKLYVDMCGNLDDPNVMKEKMDGLMSRLNPLLGRDADANNNTSAPSTAPSNTPTTSKTVEAKPAAAATPPPVISLDDEMRKRVLAMPIKKVIKKATEDEMNEGRGTLVFSVGLKFGVDHSTLQTIRDAQAGGGKPHEEFFKLLIDQNSEVMISEVTDALESLGLNRVKKLWEKITEDKDEIWDLKLGDVQPMFEFLVCDRTNSMKKSYVDLGQELSEFPSEKLDSIDDLVLTGGQFSAANELLTHLKREAVTVQELLDKLHEVNDDTTMSACQNVIDQVEEDIMKAVANEKKREERKKK